MTESKIAELRVQTAELMHELGLRLSGLLRAGDLLVLVGPLGAGKTTLARGIGEGLKVEGNVSSPTFVIARTHKRAGADGGADAGSDSSAPMVHVDAYRLGSLAEFDDLDIDFANSITLVEWGRGFAEGVVPSWLEVEISRSTAAGTSGSETEADAREVTITGFGDRWQGVTL